MKPEKISKVGVDLIAEFEGCILHPYPDPATNAEPITIGYGTTYYEDSTKVKLSDNSITIERAKELLLNNLVNYERAVSKFTRHDLTQNQFDALVSFCYNVGQNALKNSTLLRLVNANPNNPSIKQEFLKWNKAAGKVMKGLTKRRNAEAELYFKK